MAMKLSLETHRIIESYKHLPTEVVWNDPPSTKHHAGMAHLNECLLNYHFFCTFRAVRRHGWSKLMVHQVSLVFLVFYEWTSPQTHPEKKRSFLKTLIPFCCNAGIIHLAAEKDHNDTTPWTHPTFIQWQLQHGTRHVKCACHEALLPHRVIRFYRGRFTTFKDSGAETKCSAAASAMMGIPSKRGFFRQSYTTVQTEKLLVISTPTVHGRCSTLIVCKPNLSSWITTLKIHDSIMPLFQRLIIDSVVWSNTCILH